MQSTSDNAAVHQWNRLSSEEGPKSQNLALGEEEGRRVWARHLPSSSQLCNSVSGGAHNCSSSCSLVLAVIYVNLFFTVLIWEHHNRREEKNNFLNVVLAIVTTIDKRSNIRTQQLHTAYSL